MNEKLNTLSLFESLHPKEKESPPIKPKRKEKKRIYHGVGPTQPYWSTHKYKRRSTMSISHFCGWDTLLNLIRSCPNILLQGLIATLFETGGRATEVLSLTTNQFVDKGTYIVVRGMLVLKQRKLENTYRQVAMMKYEPLVEPMMDWVKQCREIGLEKLFDYKYDWLYKKVREINKDWWPHRFRGERASQLAVEKDFGVIELMKWFGWTSERMATHYAKMSVKDLVEKMSRGEM